MKSASSLEQAFVELTNALSGAERRKMFGHPAIFTMAAKTQIRLIGLRD